MSAITYLGYDNPIVRIWMQLRALQRKCQLKCGPYAWDLTKDSRVIRISRGQFSSVGNLARDFEDLFEALLPMHAGHTELLDFSRLHVHTYRAANLQFEFAQWPEPDAPIDAYLEVFRPGPTDLIFDLGAEYGVSTYLLSQLGGKIVALEPELRMRTILERNVERHQLSNVSVVKATPASMAELVGIHGSPVFCRINLDRVPLPFLMKNAEEWASRSLYIAARSNSKRTRKKFVAFLSGEGFDVGGDNDLGMLWASR